MNPNSSFFRWPCAVLAALALSLVGQVAVAQNYTVEVTPHLNGLDIGIEPVSNPGVLVVNLTNNTTQKVRCDLNFEADPQLPFQTFVFVEPGKTASATLRATQQWFDVGVEVRCKADE
jgi:Cu/Ag efflux pump CusA